MRSYLITEVHIPIGSSAMVVVCFVGLSVTTLNCVREIQHRHMDLLPNEELVNGAEKILSVRGQFFANNVSFLSCKNFTSRLLLPYHPICTPPPHNPVTLNEMLTVKIKIGTTFRF